MKELLLVAVAVSLLICSHAVVVELDDYNFEETVQPLSETPNDTWYLLIYDESEKSQNMLRIWDELDKLEQTVHIARIHHSNEFTLRRIKVKVIPSQRYIVNGKAHNVHSIASATDAQEKLTRLHLYATKTIREAPATHRLWLKYVVSFIPFTFKDHPILSWAMLIGGIVAFMLLGMKITMHVTAKKSKPKEPAKED